MTAADHGWRPIESAPRDGTKIWAYIPRIYSSGLQCLVAWDTDKYAKRPKPRFRSTDLLYRDADSAQQQPTHWQPLPPPPEPTDG